MEGQIFQRNYSCPYILDIIVTLSSINHNQQYGYHRQCYYIEIWISNTITSTTNILSV